MEKRELEKGVFEWKCQGSEAARHRETSGERPRPCVTASRRAWEQKTRRSCFPGACSGEFLKPGSLRETGLCQPGGRLLQTAYERSYTQQCR